MTAAERNAEHRALVDLIADQLDRGRPVPCVEGDVVPRAWWTDDDDEHQRLAGAACMGCSAFVACRRYGATWTKESGVYGGATDPQRQPRRGRPPKRAGTGTEAA